MKITIFALHLGFGGVEQYVSTVASMLAQEHEVTIVSTYQTTEQPAFPIDSRVTIHYLIPNDVPNAQAWHRARKEKRWIDFLKESVHAVKVLWQRRHRNIKAIRTTDADVLMSTRVFHNRLIQKYAPAHCMTITGEHNHHNNQKSYIDEVVASCVGFDFFIPISRELATFYEPLLAPHQVAVRFIPAAIQPVVAEVPSDFSQPHLVAVGRLSPEKGFDDLVRMVGLVRQKVPNIRLDLYGDGPERERVVQLVKEHHLEQSVFLHGFQNKETIAQAMSVASLFVMTSHTESFGLVLLEAMTNGLPCVAFDSAQGAHEIISEQHNGYLIANRDITEMSNVIASLLADKEQLEQLRMGAYRTVDEYRIDRIQRMWLELMEERNA